MAVKQITKITIANRAYNRSDVMYFMFVLLLIHTFDVTMV